MVLLSEGCRLMDNGVGLGLLALLKNRVMTMSLMFILAAAVWWTWKRAKAGAQSGLPGSFGMPLIGETLTYMDQMSSPLGNFVEEHTKRYGKLFKSYLFFKPTVLAAELSTVQMIVAREGKSFVSDYPTSFSVLLGIYNSLNLKGDLWKRLRRFLVGNILRADLLKDRVNVVEDLITSCLSSWEGRIVYVEDETKTIAFNVIANVLFQIEPGTLSEKIKMDFYPVIQGMFSFPIDLPWTIYGKATRARKRIVKTLESFLETRLNRIEVLDGFMEAIEDSPEVTSEKQRKEMRQDHIIGLLFAGHDTTAATMNFAVRYIGENPAVLAQLRSEHEETLKGKLAGERLTWDDCKAMTFTNDVITETLRLCNISSSVSRKSLEDVHVGGQIIPKGWHVMPSFRTIHHDPAIYPDPWRFNPWRYKEARVNGTKLPFFGFGGGPRLCPGSELARVEMCLFIHHLITKFNWKILEKDVVSFFPFPRLSKRQPIRVTPRSTANSSSQDINVSF